MVRFWNDIRKKSTTEKVEDYSQVIETKLLMFEANEGIIDIETKIKKIISFLPNWKSPGPDKVYNFFIKNCYPLHKCIASNVKKIVEDPSQMPEWMYTGMTYLIQKTNIPELPSEYRPITCMNNLYKVVTKLVAQEMRDFVEVNEILSANQLGTVRNCQGAKEQALINKNLSLYHENNLVTMWIYFKKAYDLLTMTTCSKALADLIYLRGVLSL